MNRRVTKGLWMLVAVMGLAGCSDLGQPIRLLPHAELSSTAIDFGTVAVSATASRSVIVSNSGNGALNGSASVTCAGYSIQSGGGAFTVPPGGRHTVIVVYAPSGTGTSTCQLTLGDGIPPVSLTGVGALQAPGAQCVLSVPSIDFGFAAVGGSTQGGYTITNPGTAPLLLNVVPTCADFVVLSGGGSSTLPAGGSLPVTVQFVPRAGGFISCAIANGPGCPDLTVSGNATTVSFAADIRPVLTTTCALGCHFFRSTADIVNVPGSIYPSYILIKPFDPQNSLIYRKITTPPPGAGGRMPEIGGPLSPATIDKFRRWILEGALDN